MASEKSVKPTYPYHEWVPPLLTAARRKFAFTRRLPHKKIQRSILIAERDRRKYMKDAPAGTRSTSVNAIDGRGEEENGNNEMHKHSSLRATSHQPTSNGGDKNTKALMA